jgi:pimeloyl-ACP methyl ester carboxylesterase
MPDAQIPGRTLHYVRHGAADGEPVLLIQGLSGTHASWGEEFLGALGDGLALIAYDHRGIGPSAPIDGPFTIADLAADALGLLDALGLESAHVVGISMGGMVAQELALAAPGRVRTLTLGCTYPGGPGSRLTDQATVQRILASFATGDPEAILRTSFEINVSPAYATRPGSWEAFQRNALAVRAPVPVVFEQLRATAAHDAGARLGELTMPTLVVHGDLDEVLDVSNGELIGRLVPGSRVEILHEIGHLFWIEEPGRSAALIRGHVLAGSPAARQ